MELETINKLYLELSQVATAVPKREIKLAKEITDLKARISELEELLTSARTIAQRKGEGTAWERFDESIARLGVGCITARTYRNLP